MASGRLDFSEMPETSEQKVYRYTKCLIDNLDTKSALKGLFRVQAPPSVFLAADTFRFASKYLEHEKLGKYAIMLRDKLIYIGGVKTTSSSSQQSQSLGAPRAASSQPTNLPIPKNGLKEAMALRSVNAPAQKKIELPVRSQVPRGQSSTFKSSNARRARSETAKRMPTALRIVPLMSLVLEPPPNYQQLLEKTGILTGPDAPRADSKLRMKEELEEVEKVFKDEGSSDFKPKREPKWTVMPSGPEKKPSQNGLKKSVQLQTRTQKSRDFSAQQQDVIDHIKRVMSTVTPPVMHQLSSSSNPSKLRIPTVSSTRKEHLMAPVIADSQIKPHASSSQQSLNLGAPRAASSHAPRQPIPTNTPSKKESALSSLIAEPVLKPLSSSQQSQNLGAPRATSSHPPVPTNGACKIEPLAPRAPSSFHPKFAIPLTGLKVAPIKSSNEHAPKLSNSQNLLENAPEKSTILAPKVVPQVKKTNLVAELNSAPSQNVINQKSVPKEVVSREAEPKWTVFPNMVKTEKSQIASTTSSARLQKTCGTAQSDCSNRPKLNLPRRTTVLQVSMVKTMTPLKLTSSSSSSVSSTSKKQERSSETSRVSVVYNKNRVTEIAPKVLKSTSSHQKEHRLTHVASESLLKTRGLGAPRAFTSDVKNTEVEKEDSNDPDTLPLFHSDTSSFSSSENCRIGLDVNKNEVLKGSTSSANRNMLRNVSTLDESMFRPKNDRQKMYSGRKNNGRRTVPSLISLCQDFLSVNIKNIEHVGIVPYDLLKPALINATVDELRRILDANPLLVEDADELFFDMVRREFPKYADRVKDGWTWREMYDKLVQRKEKKASAKLDMLTEKFKRQKQEQQAEGRKTMMIDQAHTRVKSKSFFTSARDTQVKMLSTPTALTLSQARKNVKTMGKEQLERITPRGGLGTAHAAAPKRPAPPAPMMAKCRKQMKLMMNR